MALVSDDIRFMLLFERFAGEGPPNESRSLKMAFSLLSLAMSSESEPNSQAGPTLLYCNI